MAKLPFLVEPRLKPVKEILGSDESGKIEIERRGFLTVAEKSFVQSAMVGDNAVTELHGLAQRIARKAGKDAQEVFKMLIGQAIDTDDVLEPYEADIANALTNLLAYQEKSKLVIAACMLINRVNQEITIEDVMELHPDLTDALATLYDEEDRKCIDALVAASEGEAKPAEEGKE